MIVIYQLKFIKLILKHIISSQGSHKNCQFPLLVNKVILF